MNTPGANTVSAAQLAFSHMISIARHIPQSHHSLKHDEGWERKKYGDGSELRGKVVGVVGCGQIGAQVARYGTSFGMRAIGFDPMIDAQDMSGMGITKVSFEDLLQEADFISLHTPQRPETENIINEESLKKCKVKEQ